MSKFSILPAALVLMFLPSVSLGFNLLKELQKTGTANAAQPNTETRWTKIGEADALAVYYDPKMEIKRPADASSASMSVLYDYRATQVMGTGTPEYRSEITVIKFICAGDGMFRKYRSDRFTGNMATQGRAYPWDNPPVAMEPVKAGTLMASIANLACGKAGVPSDTQNDPQSAQNQPTSSVVSQYLKPSEADMKQRLEQRVNAKSKGLYRVVGFKKNDGLESERGGVKYYEMDWTVTLEFLKDCLWNQSSFDAVPPPQDTSGILYATSGYQQMARGQRFNLSGRTMFTKTEKGWSER